MVIVLQAFLAKIPRKFEPSKRNKSSSQESYGESNLEIAHLWPPKATGFIGLKTGQYGDLVVLEQ